MRRLLVGVLIGVLLSVGTGLAAFLLIGSWLAVEDPLAKVDAIVAISGDTGERADTAIMLWKAGWAPIIVFSGASIDPESVSSDRKSTRLNSSHTIQSRMPSSA